MQSPSLKEATEVSLPGCCPNPFLCLADSQKSLSNSKSTSSVCRQNFAAKTTSSFFPNTHFTDHESLPSLQESLAHFTKAYPKYSETSTVDQIRVQEYDHLALSNHICLDYIGTGLFSHSQLKTQYSDFPFFSTSCKSVNLRLELLHSNQGSEFESAVKKRIMGSLNISANDYSMVFTANRSSAFKLLAESYPFQSSRKLLTVYDYDSEAVEAMINASEKRGAQVLRAQFSWPRLRIQSEKLRKMIASKRKTKNERGLFVFPLQSRMTGASYSYQWMSMAQENGWHVLLDACALGPKDMDSFALSLFHPNFLVCSFYKVFGENPTGFACLFVKKSTVSVLVASTSAGIVSLTPAEQLFQSPGDSPSGTEKGQIRNFGTRDNESSISSSFSGAVSSPILHSGRFDGGEPSDPIQQENAKLTSGSGNTSEEIEFRGLDHVDSLGLILISSRTRYLVNWLVNALMKLRHPNTEDKIPLVRIYGPKIKFNRGPALSFNVYDWKGEKIKPFLVQKLADRSNISLSHGFLHQIWFPDKYVKEKERVMERDKNQDNKEMVRNMKKGKADQGITVLTAALGFLADFEDIYRLWAFVARFLDADFVEKERWRYTALNQKIVEVDTNLIDYS